VCGIVGIINTDKELIDGSHIREAIRIQHDRGNGLGGGFAAYGIYPEYKDYYAFHIMYDGGRHDPIISNVEDYLGLKTRIHHEEEIAVYQTKNIITGPYFKRYFVLPHVSELLPGQTIDGLYC
jgi:glutamate synthase domain-containing protein 1